MGNESESIAASALLSLSSPSYCGDFRPALSECNFTSITAGTIQEDVSSNLMNAPSLEVANTCFMNSYFGIDIEQGIITSEDLAHFVDAFKILRERTPIRNQKTIRESPISSGRCRKQITFTLDQLPAFVHAKLNDIGSHLQLKYEVDRVCDWALIWSEEGQQLQFPHRDFFLCDTEQNIRKVGETKCHGYSGEVDLS